MEECVLILKIILSYEDEAATINPSAVLIDACVTPYL